MDYKTLVTDRCVLRKPKKEDAKPMLRNWASDPELPKYLTWPPRESADKKPQGLDCPRGSVV